MTRRLCWILAALSFALAAPAAAQAPADAADKNAARTLALTGRKRFEAGDYKGALTALNDAEKYFHAPTITHLRALAHDKLGQLIEARALHQEVADEKLAPNASPEFVAAQKESVAALTALDTRIPRVRIALSGAPSGTRVTLDGDALNSATLATTIIQVNPGKHTVVVEPPSGAKVTRELDLKEQAVEKVEVQLAATAPTGPVAPVATATGRSMVGPAIAFGAGGAGLLVGAITGGLAFARAGEIKKLCGDDLVCPESSRSKVDLEGAKGFGYASTVGFVVAGVGAAAGVVLLLLPGGKKKEEPARAAAVVGPGFVGVKGAF